MTEYKYNYDGITKEAILALQASKLSKAEQAASLGLSIHAYKRLKSRLGAVKLGRKTKFDEKRCLRLLEDGTRSLKEIALIMNEDYRAVEYYWQTTLKEKSGIKGKKKFPYKPWKLTKKQKSVLAGTLLGDANLRIDKLGLNARFSFAHCIEQKELFDFKAKMFKSLENCNKLKKPTPDSRTGKVYPAYIFGTKSHPNFTEIYNHLYPEGKKIVSPELLEWFDAQSLAVLFMDDGHKAPYNYSIATCAFTDEDLQVLIDFFHKKFGFLCSVHNGNTLYVPAKYRDLFTKLVKPFILPSMQYKVHSLRKIGLKLENPAAKAGQSITNYTKSLEVV